LEVIVAHAEDLIHDQNFGIHVRRNGKAKARIHSGRIPFHRRIKKLFQLGEGHNLVKLLRDLGALHPKNGAVEINIFAPGQIRMESRAQFDQSAVPSIDLNTALVRLEDAAQEFQGSAFAGAVGPDDSQRIPATQFKRDVAQGPEFLLREAFGPPSPESFGQSRKQVTQRVKSFAFAKLLPDIAK